jgi:hypothetical protein
MNKRTVHSTFKPGVKVRLIMRDGTTYVDKFVDKKSGCMIMEKLGRISLNRIRATAIYKPLPHEQESGE